MADVDLEALSVEILGVLKWTCMFDVSMGPGERPRRGVPCPVSAMMARGLLLSYSHVWSLGWELRSMLRLMRLLISQSGASRSSQVMSVVAKAAPMQLKIATLFVPPFWTPDFMG
jgi:hypothetical protein